MIRFFVALTIVLHSFSSSGQKFSVQHFTSENGLPQNTVNSIARDNFNFIWLSTQSGLVRFDGHSFRNFSASDLGITSNRFMNFRPFPRNKNGFYIQSQSREIVAVEAGVPKSLPGGEPWAPDASAHGGVPPLVTGDRPYSDRLVSSSVTHGSSGHWQILPTRRGQNDYFFLSFEDVRYYKNGREMQRWPPPEKKDLFFFALDGQLIHQGLDNRFTWYASDGKKEIPLSGDITVHPLYSSRFAVRRVFSNNITGQAFVGLGKSFYSLEWKGGTLATKLLLEDFDFEKNGIISVYYDEDLGRIYLGSLTDGLYVFSRKLFWTVGLPESIKDDISFYYAQIVRNDSTVVSGPGHVFSGNPLSGRITARVLKSMDRSRPFGLFSVAKEQNGTTWFSSRFSLFSFQDGKDELKEWKVDTEILTIYIGPENILWMGTNRKGIIKVNLNMPFAIPVKRYTSFPVEYEINSIAALSPDTLLVGTQDGLFKLNTKTNKINQVEGFKGVYVRNLLVPHPNEAWVSTYGNGIYLLKNNKVVQFPIDADRNLATAHCIIEDKSGFFWITTNNGLFQVKKADLLTYAGNPKRRNAPLYVYYGKQSGFKTTEFNGGCSPCAVRMGNGFVSLPSMNGLVWFMPEMIKSELPVNPFIVDNFEYGGKRHEWTGKSLPLNNEDEIIKVNLAMAYGGHESAIQFSYALLSEGEQPKAEDWIDAEHASKSFFFANPGAGKYRLYIQKRNGFGPNNYSRQSIPIIVPYAWYETWWFRILSLALFAGAIYLLMDFRVKRLKRNQRRLQLTIARKTLNLQMTVESLRDSEEQLDKQLKLQSFIISSISHDIRSPVKMIHTTLPKIAEMAEAGKLSDVRNIVGIVTESVGNVRSFLDGLVSFIISRRFAGVDENEKIELYKFIEERCRFLQNSGLLHDRFHIDIPQDSHVFSNRNLLGIVVQNLIDNALKYSGNTPIHIYTELHAQALYLWVSNEVKENPEETYTLIRNVFRTDGEGSNPGVGLGLILIKEIANEINLQLMIEREEAGIRIAAIIPINSSSLT